MRLGDHVGPPPRARRLHADSLGELGQDVHRARVVDRVDRVHAEAVDVELAHPGAPILDDVTSDTGTPLAVEVHRGAPRRLVPVGAVRPVFREVIALGAEVVVDDVEEDGEPGRVARVHQATEPARAAIGRLRSVEVDAIVTPVARARELGDWHQLDGGHAEVGERGKMRDDRLERPGRCERAHVELVDDQVARRVAAEVLVGPEEAPRIHHRRGPVHALGLPARDRVGTVPLAV